MFFLFTRVIFATLTFFSIHAHAASNTGTLYATGGPEGLDWYAPPEFGKSLSSLATNPIKFQSRFIWSGPTGAPLTGDDRAIVVFGQGANQAAINSDLNPSQPDEDRRLWTSGVGAYVGASGLAIKLWYPTGQSYVIEKESPEDIGCLIVPSEKKPSSTQPSAISGNYLTDPPANWQLKSGVPYWVRITITQESNKGRIFGSLYAELIEEGTTGAKIIQTGKFRFNKSTFFPEGDSIRGFVARRAGTGQDISYAAFDEGF